MTIKTVLSTEICIKHVFCKIYLSKPDKIQVFPNPIR